MGKINLQKGVALIAVLWVTAFLATIASTVAHQSRSSLQMTKNRIEMLKLKQTAESVILLSIANIINAPEKQDVYIDTNLFAGNDKNLKVEFSLEDESGKIDLNNAPVSVMQSLLLEIGLDESEASRVSNAILDWRDEDNLVRADGAEDAQYQAQGYPYGAKDAEFERIEELKLIYGMTPELYSAIAPFITVYTQDFGVNLSIASSLVQRAVKNANLISLDQASEEGELEDLEGEEFTTLTSGYIFTFRVKATGSNNISQNISAIVRIDRGNTYEPFTVLKWVQS